MITCQIRTGNSHLHITKQINTDSLITNFLLVNNVSLPMLAVKLWLSLPLSLFGNAHPYSPIIYMCIGSYYYSSYYTINKFSTQVTYQQQGRQSLH